MVFLFKTCEKWIYAGKQITIEPCCFYLGVIFTSTLMWAKCTDNSSGKALKIFAGIRKLYLKNIPPDIIFKIIDMKIKPVLL